VYRGGQTLEAAEKVVFSRSLQSVSTKRTRIERSFDHDFVRDTADLRQPLPCCSRNDASNGMVFLRNAVRR